MTIGKVLAQRCLESGISEVLNTYEPLPGSKVSIIYFILCRVKYFNYL